ncbi:MAG: MotA/TolQ/ExbB proton channel family protein [Pseudomonadota bacterium]
MTLITDLYDLGGPVLMILLIISVFTLALIFYKAWQFQTARVGKGGAIKEALSNFDKGDREEAYKSIDGSQHFLASVVESGFYLSDQSIETTCLSGRIESEAEQAIIPLERGFRVLDIVAQLAPLLGLLGTVIGMIEAFQALQGAGSQVDPSLLAGGIWVALLTTAVGLSVAMPTSVALTWLESRMDNERNLADHAVAVITAPKLSTTRP